MRVRAGGGNGGTGDEGGRSFRPLPAEPRTRTWECMIDHARHQK